MLRPTVKATRAHERPGYSRRSPRSTGWPAGRSGGVLPTADAVSDDDGGAESYGGGVGVGASSIGAGWMTGGVVAAIMVSGVLVGHVADRVVPNAWHGYMTLDGFSRRYVQAICRSALPANRCCSATRTSSRSRMVPKASASSRNSSLRPSNSIR